MTPLDLITVKTLILLVLPTFIVIFRFIRQKTNKFIALGLLLTYFTGYGFLYNFLTPSIVLISCLITSLLMVALINFIIDPLGIYFFIYKEGFNTYKPDSFKFMGIAKVFRMSIIKPDTIILGNSREAIGIPTDHCLLDKNTYNASVFATTMIDLFQFLKFAHKNKPIKTAIIGLSFTTFNTYYKRDDYLENDDRLFETKILNPPGKIKQYSSKLFLIKQTLLNLNVLHQSKNCLTYRKINYFIYKVTDSGLCSWQKPIKKLKEGVRSMFLNSINKSFETLLDDSIQCRFSLDNMPNHRSKMDTLAELIDFTQNHNINLKLFISPIHASQICIINKLNLKDDYKYWLRTLTDVVSSHSNAKNPVPLCDFSGCNSITTEKVPSKTNKFIEMENYLDSSHYKTNIGNLILDKLLNNYSNDMPDDFGVFLTKKNIEDHIKNLDTAEQNYRENDCNEVQEVNRLLKLYKENIDSQN